ncbi:Rv1355c family protein [Rhodococcus artemisiae]|uniref:Rv1355c family protein n=1 Tax=Rhodococcus artemisiae TaxID=714159 RepID=A0ABU7LDM1_9NOCA|nr:Rv1355c family protein [Rhodococcus artemisiae]MEE2059649.1 Rv1355c family protein [Rhodococcus artemisiae]
MSAGPVAPGGAIADAGHGDHEAHSAVLLSEDRPDHVDELERLRDEAGVVLVDRLVEQREGLHRLGAGAARDETPRWAYYPWRSTAIRVLGPKSFRRLRLDRNRNKITAAEQERLESVTAGIVGLSVGHAVAHTLALEGVCGEIRLADFDVLELSNLNRVPGTLLDLGINKAVVAARRIAETDPYLPVRVWCDGVVPRTVSEFLDGVDVLVDECDSLDVKMLLRVEAARRRIPVVMHTSDRGLIDVERFDLEPERLPFHGLLGDVDVEALSELSSRDKVPHVLRILGTGELSTRLAASMLEIDETLEAWPQLASDVALGGATIAAVIRHIVLGNKVDSGRGRVDLDVLLERLESPAAHATETPAQPNVQPVPDEPVEAMVHAAIRAPSGGNSQPWSITVEPRRLVFAIAPEPAPVLMDLRHRGSCIAVGAALFNAKVAAAAHGILGRVSVPSTAEIDQNRPVATLEFGDGADPHFSELYGPVLARATNRHPTHDRVLTGGEVTALYDAAALESGRIRVVTDPGTLEESAEILAESDRIRYLTRELRRDMVGELRWHNSEDADSGIEVKSLGLDAAESAMLDVVLRDDVLDQLDDWDLGGGLGRITRDRVRGSAALVVVLTEGGAASDYVHAGTVVESVWVRAQALGLAVQPVSPIFMYADTLADLDRLSHRHAGSLDALRKKFGVSLGVADDDRIALVMRIGRARYAPDRSRRRPDRVRYIHQSELG